SRALIDQAFWHACAGGQRRCAELLADHGADLGFTPDYGSGSVLDAAASPGTQRSNLIEWLQERGVPRTA
ncbi:MAG TPA: hypothetical protein VN088_14900, partial [Nocardioides sp.]|nr:hypothetical protein [Nocardioides sp.]